MHFQVGDNGIVSLNNSYNSYIPTLLPQNGSKFIAPYWADVDLRGTGQIYYRQTKNPTLLARATKQMQKTLCFSQNLIVTSLFIVTWDAVGYFNKHTDKVRLCNLICACMYINRE